MFKLKNSLVAVAGLSLVTGLIALIALITPTRTHGQGQGGNQQPLNVNVVNAPTVRVTDLYPAEPFQKNLTVPATGEGVCVSIPEDRGLIIELVTARTTSSSALATFVLGMRTTAGSETPVLHNIALQRQQGTDFALLTVTQPLRAYAGPGTDLCFDGIFLEGGPFLTSVTFSGQLVRAP